MDHESRAETKRWYARTNWIRLRTLQLKTSPLCAICLHSGKLTVASVVDHVEPRSKGGEDYDVGNLQSLCPECHNRKTRRDAGVTTKPVARGCSADGTPIDPDHPWHDLGYR